MVSFCQRCTYDPLNIQHGARPLNNKLLIVGIVGSILAALCCFTPLLPIVLGALGMTGLLGILYNDAILLPLLAGFLLLTGYAWWRKTRRS